MSNGAADTNDSKRVAIVGAALLIVVLAVYFRVIDFEFVNYDDNKYIQMNPVVLQGVTASGAAWAFQTFRLANWHPVTWLSHMLDVELFGLDAGMHHLMNVLLHCANSVLILILFWRMTASVWRSALVAALFALHPLHVESVAWISERKDVLSTLFGLLTIMTYVRWLKAREKGEQEGARVRYALLLVLYALSLMSKPMLVTLPCVMLLLDYWPLRRSFCRALIIEKMPLVAMAAASCVVTVIAQSRGGAITSIESLSIGQRLANAFVAYATYLLQTVWPQGLSPLYPLPEAQSAGIVIVSLSVLLMITGVALALARRNPAIIVGWLWFLGTLVPVIGLVQVGAQAHADRYTYVPLIGVFVMLAWAIPDMSRTRAGGIITAAAASAVIVMCSAVTWRQIGYWRDSITLSQRAIDVDPNNAVAHFNLANALTERNEFAAAIEHLRKAADLKPAWADVDFNLGNALVRVRDSDAAIKAYRQAVTSQPRFVAAWINLGAELARSGQPSAAIEAFERALEIDPQSVDALSNLGETLVSMDRLREAEEFLAAVLRVEPGNPIAHLRMGTTLAKLDQLPRAIEHFRQAVAIDPSNAVAEMYLATALRDSGQLNLAVRHFERAASLARSQRNESLEREIARRVSELRAAQSELPRDQ